MSSSLSCLSVGCPPGCWMHWEGLPSDQADAKATLSDLLASKTTSHTNFFYQ